MVVLALLGGAVLAPGAPGATTLIATGSVWKYFDSGTDLGTAWRGLNFDDASWPGGRAQLGYGDGDEATLVANGANPKPVTIYFRHTFVLTNPVSTTDHEVRLTGLAPGTKYFYAIGHGDQLLATGPDYCFVTAPLTNKPTRIWVIGDFGTGDTSQAAVRDAYAAFAQGEGGERPTDFWLMLGDNAYEVGTDEEYQSAVFDMYGPLLRRSVVWPTLGNHDAGSAGVREEFPYLEIFSLPRQGEAGGVASGTESMNDPSS